MQSPYKDFASVVKANRKKLGISQRELARKAQLSSGYMARIENDSAIPGSDIIERLSKSLNISHELLKGFANIPKKRKLDVLNNYPAIIELFQRIKMAMNDDEVRQTFKRFEKRIALFDEEPYKLTHNFCDFLAGKLSPTEQPANGGRPLCHYWISWSKEMEEWGN